MYFLKLSVSYLNLDLTTVLIIQIIFRKKSKEKHQLNRIKRLNVHINKEQILNIIVSIIHSSKIYHNKESKNFKMLKQKIILRNVQI